MYVDGIWKLGDFSLVATKGPQGSEPFVVDPNGIGTNGYRAPEQITLSQFNEKVDIWGIGCIMHELVIGKPLFLNDYAIAGSPSGYTEKAATGVDTVDVIQPLSVQLNSCLSSFHWKDKHPIKMTLLQMLAVSPQERPTAHEIIRDSLQKLIDAHAPAIRTESGLR